MDYIDIFCENSLNKCPHADIELNINGDTANMQVPAYDIKKVKKIYKNKSVRKWTRTPFVNQSRSDGLILNHWRPIDCMPYSNSNPYPFSILNKHLFCPSINPDVYARYFHDENWTFETTDFFIKLCNKYDLNFIPIHDRLLTKFSELSLSVLDLKKRFVDICKINDQIFESPNGTNLNFDYHYEKKRRSLLENFQKQTFEDIENEHYLQDQLSIIKDIKFQKNKEPLSKPSQDIIIVTQDEPINAESTVLENQSENSAESPLSFKSGTTNYTPAIKKGRTNLKKIQSNFLDTPVTPNPSPVNKIIGLCNKVFVHYKFPDVKPVGISLRSQRHKIPQNVGTRRIKALTNALFKLKVDVFPPAVNEVCDLYCSLRSDLVGLYDLKHTLINLEFEYQKLKQKFSSTFPDIPFPYKDNELEIFSVISSSALH